MSSKHDGRFEVELHIDVTDWPKATEHDVRSLFLAVYDELSQALGVKVPVPIYLSWHVDVPRTQSFLDRTNIFLNARGTGWSQFVYQAALEITHALVRDFSWMTGRQRHKWFEEAVCELASYYVLAKFATSWQRAPIPGLAGFEATKNYAIQHEIYRLRDATKTEPFPDDLSTWFRANVETLTSNPYLRKSNAVLSVALLPEFVRYPNLWRDCAHLNQWDTTQDEIFEDYLKSWWLYMRSKDLNPQGVPLDVAEFLGIDIGVKRIGHAPDVLTVLLPGLRVYDNQRNGSKGKNPLPEHPGTNP